MREFRGPQPIYIVHDYRPDKPMRALLVLAAVLAWPMAEIAVFILVGERIGLIATVLGVFATAAVGLYLVQAQGVGVIARLRAQMDRGEAPTEEAAHAALIAAGGILVLIPGFITDALGALLLIPPVRSFLIRHSGGNVRVVMTGMRERQRTDTVDLDPEEWSSNGGRKDPSSPWHEGGDKRLR